LDGIVEATTEKCLRLRDPEDSFRDSFRANTPVLESQRLKPHEKRPYRAMRTGV